MKDYAQLQAAIDTYLEQIEKDGEWHDEAQELLLQATDAWEEVYDEFVERLTEEYAGKTSRLPGEDARLSLCRQEHRETWRTFKRAESAEKKYNKRLSRAKAALSALQSQLKGESTAGNGPQHSGRQPAWSGP